MELKKKPFVRVNKRYRPNNNPFISDMLNMGFGEKYATCVDVTSSTDRRITESYRRCVTAKIRNAMRYIRENINSLCIFKYATQRERDGMLRAYYWRVR